MIEKLDRFPRVYGIESGIVGADVMDLHAKINELINASNRQDKAIAWLLAKNSHYRSEIVQDLGEADEWYFREINRG